VGSDRRFNKLEVCIKSVFFFFSYVSAGGFLSADLFFFGL
jgi:hypothetical protein